MKGAKSLRDWGGEETTKTGIPKWPKAGKKKGSSIAPMVIASGAIDRRHLSPFTPTSDDSSSSFFSQDLVPTEVLVINKPENHPACHWFLFILQDCSTSIIFPSMLHCRGKLDFGIQSQWWITKVWIMLHLKIIISWLLLLTWWKLFRLVLSSVFLLIVIS